VLTEQLRLGQLQWLAITLTSGIWPIVMMQRFSKSYRHTYQGHDSMKMLARSRYPFTGGGPESRKLGRAGGPLIGESRGALILKEENGSYGWT